MPSHETLRLAAIGTLAGIFSGLFGVGGGTVIVPLLIFWFGYGERLATGTSLAAIVLIGLLGAIAQGGIYGNVHVATGLLLAIPAVLGVVMGTAIQQRIPQRAVSYLFAALLVGNRDRADPQMNELLAVLVAAAGGLAGGLVGVGGGVLFVPALTIFLGLSQVEAESTSLLMIVIVALVGAYRQSTYGNVRLREALIIGVLSPLGVLIGVAVANHVSERVLQLSFAALALFIAAQLVRRARSASLAAGVRRGQTAGDVMASMPLLRALISRPQFDW